MLTWARPSSKILRRRTLPHANGSNGVGLLKEGALSLYAFSA